MQAVQILAHEGAIVLRKEASELLILPQFVDKLKELDDKNAFSEFFLGTALVNRGARKLFVAWSKKDNSVWPRLYKTVQDLKAA